MSNTLTVYGASDDLVEFEGVYTEEFNVYGPSAFMVRITNDGRRSVFCVTANFGNGWELSVGTNTGGLEFPVEIEFTHRPDREDDPAIVFTLAADDEVVVERL